MGVLIRRVRLRMACLVAPSLSRGAAGRRNAAHLATWAAVVRPRSWSRKSTGALMMRALGSLIAAVRGWLNSITCSPAALRYAHAPDL